MTNTDQTISASPRIPAAAYALCLCIGLIGANSLALGPIAPRVAASFASDVPAVMSASAAFGIGTAASALLLGGLIDRFGPGRVLRFALLVFLAALAASAAAPILSAFVAAQLLAGLAAGLALPSIYTLAALAAPSGRESDTLGVVLFGWTLSMVAGVSLSAVIADMVGWRMVYGIVAVAGLAAIAGTATLGASGASARPAQSPLSALRVPGITPLLCACAAFMASFYGVYAYVGDHLHHALGLPVSAGGLLALCYGLGFGATTFLDRAIDRLGPARLLPAFFLAVCGIYLLMALAAASYAALLAVVFGWGMANHAALNVLIVRLAALDPGRRGAIMGLNSGVTYLALFVGTAGFGPIYAAAGFAALAGLAAALTLVAALAATLAPRPAVASD
ncbi:MFS transporter [Bosea sp. BK604]|uniref:MFS transporter n=1 Tax=Bosea sp. BK604 TaxID=2512180 RepID=UPI001053CDF9|nr:MFS transporter [Bosea sp. BK604]TCR59423.1 putative MFS family arabinose efflux permease [Bosea sp. BK604]